MDLRWLVHKKGRRNGSRVVETKMELPGTGEFLFSATRLPGIQPDVRMANRILLERSGEVPGSSANGIANRKFTA